LNQISANERLTAEERILEARTLALQITDILTEKTPAIETIVLDISERSSFADFFVVCSGENERQLRAISGTVQDILSSEGRFPRRTEGESLSGWIVIDYGDVLVHVFDADVREFYRLEDLWQDARTVVSIQ
jgi:ribosome-associated protein